MLKFAAIATTLAMTTPAVAAEPVPPTVLPPALAWSGASEKLVAPAGDPWITPAEAAGFRTTPRFDEMRSWLEHLDKASPLISVASFGKTGEGRDLLMVRASKGSAGKPVVLVQAGIHSGEIDGKDAGLMLLRDIAMRGKQDLLDRVDLVFVPILNIDGHERASPWNFLHVRGPDAKGTEGNARDINLNRDYSKLDTPEVRAIVALLQRLDPVLYIDCHVSGGFDMQYDVTYTYAGWGKYARHRATALWLEQRFGPTVKAALTRAGHEPIIYPSPIDTRDPQKGIRYSPEGPRYSTGYGDFIGVPTVLVENHMLKPYRQRVLGTYVLLEAALELAAQDADRIAEAKAIDRAERPVQLLTRWTPAKQPIGWVDRFKGVAFDTYRSPATGRMEQRWTGKRITFRMPIIGQDPVESVRLPVAWLVPAAQREVIEKLRLHGIGFEALASDRTLPVDTVHLQDVKLAKAHDGRIPVEARFTHEQAETMVRAGTVRVPADQPLGLLAAALLEPESQDSFLAWGLFPEVLSPPAGTEDFVMAPILDALLQSNPQVRLTFESKLAADAAFASDPEARMAWLAERLPHRDPFSHVYPVLRELPQAGG
ncbi:M14 family metallopeptidase [Novosphingobium panipatense]|uniref:Zinc carboxypeptidase n=1 Tax=Novosphingobium panipatense TaxID=428991 RepID=A0ABY1PYJ3_9SPHN|nr:M14 family metallopeptidase [Novosphingobium panipatense]SMP53148.1 Zinc carboxypeptidase [Novosphingobium panipatense]